KLGTNVIVSGLATAFGTSKTNTPFVFDFSIDVKATGASGKLDTFGVYGGQSNAAIAGFQFMTNSTTANSQAAQTQGTFDLTAAYTFDFQVNMSATGNSTTLTQLKIEVLA